MTTTTRAEHNRRIEISNDLGLHAVERIHKVLDDQMGLCSTHYMRFRVLVIVAGAVLRSVDDYLAEPLKKATGAGWETDPGRRWGLIAGALRAMSEPEPPESDDDQVAVAGLLAAFCLKHPDDPDLKSIALMMTRLLSATNMLDEIIEKIQKRRER